MNKLIIVYVVLIVAVIFLLIMRGGGSFFSFLPSFGNSATAEINGTKFNLLISNTEPERMKGLSGRKSLDKNQGMIFIFDKPDTYGFWMKDMLFSIDIIYINKDKVVYIVNNAPAPTGQASPLTIYKPDAPANYVLEVNAGTASKLKIVKGTTVTLKNVK